MKKTLLALVLVCSSYFCFSQLKINEIYQISDTSSGTKNRQFFELALHPTIKQQQNSDSYVLLSYFKTATDSGFYVLDLPSKIVKNAQDTTKNGTTIHAGGFFVAASDSSASSNKFVFQNNQIPDSAADFYWKKTTKDASVKKFKYIAGTWVEDVNANFDKIFSLTTPNTTNGRADTSKMVVFLYRKTSASVLSFVDVFVASTDMANNPPAPIKVPLEIFKFNDLKFKMSIGAPAVNPAFNDTVTMRFNDSVFKSRNANPAGLNAVSTTDEGFFFCGGWGVLPSNSTKLTPDKTNTTMLGEQFEAQITCPADIDDPTSISISLVKGEQSAFPVRLQIFADKNSNQKLDQGDLLRYTSPEPQEIDGEWVDSLINSLGATYYLPFSKAASDTEIIVVMKANGTCYDAVVPRLCDGGITDPLPITLLSFDAQRSGSSNQVLLNWKTASEFNNKGFYIQRRFGDRQNWYPVAFISSKAPDGSNGYSNTVLSYNFTDANPSKGVTQYRLMQADNDGKASFSQVRSVQGLEQAGKLLIYPVPSTSGLVNVVFEDASAPRNVVVTDMVGRMLRQWKGVSNGSMQINNLAPGMYNIRIFNTRTNKQTIARIIVIH